MYFTLIELERTHKCPMVVKDAFTGMHFLVIRKDPETSSLYEVKPLREETHKPELGTPTNLIYGGYSRWLFIRKEKTEGISPEAQKRAAEEERKKTNAQLVNGLRRENQAKRLGKEKESSRNSTNAPSPTEGKVIPFRPK